MDDAAGLVPVFAAIGLKGLGIALFVDLVSLGVALGVRHLGVEDVAYRPWLLRTWWPDARQRD